MATLAAPLQSAEQWRNPNCVKVVCDAAGTALYFSRSPIPFVRDGQPDFDARPPRFLQHLGIYAYRRRFLLRLADLPPHPLEQLEKLEQLRVLAHGRRIQVGVVGHAHDRRGHLRRLPGASWPPGGKTGRVGPREGACNCHGCPSGPAVGILKGWSFPLTPRSRYSGGGVGGEGRVSKPLP